MWTAADEKFRSFQGFGGSRRTPTARTGHTNDVTERDDVRERKDVPTVRPTLRLLRARPVVVPAGGDRGCQRWTPPRRPAPAQLVHQDQGSLRPARRQPRGMVHLRPDGVRQRAHGPREELRQLRRHPPSHDGLLPLRRTIHNERDGHRR